MTTTFIGASGQSHPHISSDPVAILRLGLRLELGTPLVNEVNTWLAETRPSERSAKSAVQGRARSYLAFNNAAMAEFVTPVGTPRVGPTARWPSRRRSAPRILAPTITPPSCRCGKAGPANDFRLAIERLSTTWVRTIALVAFRRTTGGVVPSDLLVTLSDVVLAVDGVGAGPIVAGPPADHGESTRVRPAAR